MQTSRASLLLAPLVILFLFAPALSGKERLAFRDVSHFYTPLYDYVAARTSDQWLPLWNPLDQTGMPLLGETSTAVLYPVRYLLFALPIPTATALAWYVALHLILSSLTARTAARWSGVSAQAANIAGMLYSLCGTVLFLYTNPPFLVSAAWLPLVLGVMLAKQQTDDRTRIIIAAPAMAMMILGGDPQTALHAMIVASLFWLLQLIRRNESTLSLNTLIAIPIIAAMLSAPQIAASVSWSRQSDRAAPQHSGAWHDPPAVGSRRAESFQFSLPPWHLVELVTPNASGSLFPTYRRFSQMITGDGRMWTPTIYSSMAVVAALLLCLFRRTSVVVDRWLVVAIAGLCLSFGHFGVVMLIQSTTGQLANIDSAVGGPYWLLYHAVPGYDSFRYPIKWLPIFAIGLSIVSARVLDRYDWQPIAWRWFAITVIACLAAIGVIAVLRHNPTWITDKPSQFQDEFWGPLDLDGGLLQLQWSVLHSAIALLAILSLTRLPISIPSRLLVLLLVVGIDLGVASRNWIATVPIEREHTLIENQGLAPVESGSRWMRTQTGDGWPIRWKRESDPHRMLDVESSLRASHFGRWHLADRIGMFNNMVSIRSQGMKEFWEATRSATAGMSWSERQTFWNGIRRWLSIDGVTQLRTSVSEVPDRNRVALMIDQQRTVQDTSKTLRFAPGVTEESLHAQNNIAFPQRLVELVAITPDSIDLETPAEHLLGDGQESTLYRAVAFDQPGLLARPIYQDGHWKAEFSPSGTDRWTAVDVHQVDRITQGLILPAGVWDVRFRYDPNWLMASVIMAAASWLGIIVWCRS